MSIILPSATLLDIRAKVRAITGRPDVTQISDSEIDFQINTFYQYDMPEHLRLFTLKGTFDFSTANGKDTYFFDPNININFTEPAYIDGYKATYSQSRDEFQRLYPKLSNNVSIGTGDGTSGPYTFTAISRPILRATVNTLLSPPVILESDILISAVDSSGNTHALIDDGFGTLIPDPNRADTTIGIADTGVIDYDTGVLSVTFDASILASEFIHFHSVPYIPSRPVAIQYFKNYLTLRPVPDQAYKVSLETFGTPTELAAIGDNPALKQWWQYIAFGASLKIFENNGDTDEYMKTEIFFKKQERLVNRRTVVQNTQQRTTTIYTDQVNYDYWNFNRRF